MALPKKRQRAKHPMARIEFIVELPINDVIGNWTPEEQADLRDAEADGHVMAKEEFTTQAIEHIRANPMTDWDVVHESVELRWPSQKD